MLTQGFDGRRLDLRPLGETQEEGEEKTKHEKSSQVGGVRDKHSHRLSSNGFSRGRKGGAGCGGGVPGTRGRNKP